MKSSDTIAAIATATGPAGIAITRISGPEAFSVANRITNCLPPESSSDLYAHYARFRDSVSGKVLDDGVVLFFKAPHSYTGEDVVELQGHGGRIPTSRLLDAVLAAGARIADPGEFTRRAFLNGRMDLARAEAVMDFIHASSDRAAISAREQLDGELSTRLNTLFDEIIALEADVENLLDFNENEIPESFFSEAAERCNRQLEVANRLLESRRTGAFLRDGAVVVICGKPNAGKSSLLNALLGRSRAIVSPIAGTTRDTIEEMMVVHGIPVRLIDTAGLRDSADAIEAEGVTRAEEQLANADLVLEVIDARYPAVGETMGGRFRSPKITIHNKVDLLGGGLKESPTGGVLVSAKTGYGLAELLAKIASVLDETSPMENSTVTISARHAESLNRAVEALRQAEASLILRDEGLVIAAENLAIAVQAIGAITGRIWSDELLDTIFSRFCIGK